MSWIRTILESIFLVEIMILFLDASSILIGKMFGMHVESIRIMKKHGIRINKDKPFVWNEMMFFCPFLYITVGKNDKTSKDDKKFHITLAIFCWLFVLGFAALMHSHIFEKNNVLYQDIKVFSESTIMFITVYSFIMLWMLLSGRMEQFRIIKDILNQMRAGVDFEQLDLPLDYIYNSKTSTAAKQSYMTFCSKKAYALKDYNTLNSVIREMDKSLSTSYGSKEDTSVGCYYEIIFYSSYVMYNPSNAMKYYEKIKNVLEKDMDINGRRVLAYFQYYVLKRPDLAEISIDQAINMDDSVKANLTHAEMKYEKVLIEELKSNMKRDADIAYQKQ